jgi:hypothetical protein
MHDYTIHNYPQIAKKTNFAIGFLACTCTLMMFVHVQKWDGLKHYFKQNLKDMQSWNGVDVFGFENGSFYT